MAKPDWITLSKNSGSGNDTVSIEAQPNAQRYCREGTITVNSGNGSVSKQVKVSQFGAATYNIDLTFVGVPEGILFKISSCYYTFAGDAAEDDDSTYIVKVKLLNDGLPFQLPDGSTTLELPVEMVTGESVGTGKKTFTTPFKISSKDALSLYKTMFATSSLGTVVVDKNSSNVMCEKEKLAVDTSNISETAAGGATIVTVDTQDSVTWTVE